MGSDGRNFRERVSVGRHRKRAQSRLLSLIKVIALIVVALQMKEIDANLKQIRIVLKRIEIPQYESHKATEDAFGEADYVNSIGIVNVGRPVQRTWPETLSRLDSLGQVNLVIAGIREESSRYPKCMLAALANNPEMADYVAGYLSGKKNAAGGLTEVEKGQDFPLLLQWDPRWGYQAYGSDSYIGVSGCGPTCLSMALYSLTGDETLTPDRIAEYAVENSYYVEGTGTAWALMKDFPRFYGVRVTEPVVAEDAFKMELDQGNILICAMGRGDFTTAGHFIVIYGYDETGFKVNDPNCVARSRKSWSFREIRGQIKGAWSMQR